MTQSIKVDGIEKDIATIVADYQRKMIDAPDAYPSSVLLVFTLENGYVEKLQSEYLGHCIQEMTDPSLKVVLMQMDYEKGNVDSNVRHYLKEQMPEAGILVYVTQSSSYIKTREQYMIMQEASVVVRYVGLNSNLAYRDVSKFRYLENKPTTGLITWDYLD